MAARLSHRGPDDSGAWLDEEAGIALGFQRLAVLDLTKTGAQPMVSDDDRWVIVFNGEVYNHAELRTGLSRHRFKGTSDTEVLLAAISRWGLVGALKRSDAMFALAAWDRRERKLHLAVDRFGEKPLYHGWLGSRLLFASELGALAGQRGLDRAINPSAAADLLTHGYIAGPSTIYSSISKVQPGTVLTYGDGTGIESSPATYVWWSAREAAFAARRTPSGDPVEALRSSLRVSVGRRMVADVPVGAFLSGGLDSSLIVALMQESASRPIQTFTVGFDRADYDESIWAHRVAEVLGTRHTEEHLSTADVQALVPRLAALLSEPFADSSFLPTHLVSVAARRKVTVVLAGDGGDELFGGYGRHVAHRWWARAHRIPAPLRVRGAKLARSVPFSVWDRLARLGGVRLETYLGQARIGEKLEKLARAAEAEHPDLLFMALSRIWPGDTPPVLHLPESRPPPALSSDDLDFAERAMLADTTRYLPGDLLVKTDRASMAASLECRLPFLSPGVFEAAWSMPSEYRAGTGRTKRVVRELLSHYLPQHLIDRPKMGFGVPIGDWLRGSLRPWASDLLSQSALRSGAVLDPVPIGRMWDEHLTRRRDHGQSLWAVCVLQDWLSAERSQPRQPRP